MSLINQMLKDLDKRGSGASGNEAYPGRIRSVPERSGGRRLLLIVALLLVASGAAAWFFWQQPSKAPAAPPQPTQASATPTPVQSQIVPPAIQVVAPPQPAQAAAADNRDEGKKPGPVAGNSREESGGSTRAKNAMAASSAEAAMKLAMRDTMSSIPSPDLQAAKASSARHSTRQQSRSAGPVIQSKETTPQQQAENDFGNAISLIGSGRKSEAIAALEGVLALNPRHAAARQTLTGLLLDGKRPADAARVLEEGLKLDPTQSGMAMILARIQIGNGDSKIALSTLQRSLPHAVNRPDYLAFMAALLQREKRHKEAVSLYTQALEKSPQNAHWWMGCGISLLADNRPAEARQAFTRARDLHTLSPELQAFVEQEISKI